MEVLFYSNSKFYFKMYSKDLFKFKFGYIFRLNKIRLIVIVWYVYVYYKFDFYLRFKDI